MTEIDKNITPIATFTGSCEGTYRVAQDNPIETELQVFPGGEQILFCPALLEGRCIAPRTDIAAISSTEVLQYPSCDVLPGLTKEHPEDEKRILPFTGINGEYAYDRKRRRITHDGTELTLNPGQARIVECMAGNPEDVFDVPTLFKAYKRNPAIRASENDKTHVRVRIGAINKLAEEKFGAKLIFNIVKLGYSLTPPASIEPQA